MEKKYYQFGNEEISSFYESSIYGIRNNLYNIDSTYFEELYLNPLKSVYDDSIFQTGHIFKHKNILIAGDTITHPGCGPDYNYKWPVLLSKELNQDFHSVALMGSSVVEQVKRIFAYIEKYGKPKYIFAIFSQFNRMEIPKNEYFYKYYRDTSKKEIEPTNIRQACIIGDTNNQKLTIPYDPEFLFSEEFPQLYSALFIQILEQYCKEAGIVLVWSTWSSNQDKIINKAISINSSKYAGYFSVKNEDWQIDYDKNKYIYTGNDYELNCHDELKNHEEFDFVFTEPNNPSRAFWGIHRHIHLKDLFVKKINTLDLL